MCTLVMTLLVSIILSYGADKVFRWASVTFASSTVIHIILYKFISYEGIYQLPFWKTSREYIEDVLMTCLKKYNLEITRKGMHIKFRIFSHVSSQKLFSLFVKIIPVLLKLP